MSKFENIKGVAFDLDGTLVDSAPGLSDAIDHALYALELPEAGIDRVKNWIGNGADVLIERALAWALPEQKNLDQQKIAAGRTVHQTPDVPDSERLNILRMLFDRFYGEYAESGSVLYPEVDTSLQALKQAGFSIGLVTNKPTQFVAPLLRSLGIEQYFDVVVGGDDVEHKKPHPEALLHVMEKLAIQPQQLLFVGDSRNDIMAAQAAECPCIGLTYGYNYGEAISLSAPDVVFDRFSEILPALGLPISDHQE